ncbi:substrate-binding domain-containing protein [Flavobacterium sp. WC2509]|uniref:substrate-binding domain-containing protein n=1 Tax=Flavobacterium sp. WC2509 TaxID=3461406 RepID=UPI004043E8C2
MEKIYTIKDIAELANVSKGTVDRVLHNRGKVSKIALDKVNEVLRTIDYKPNLIARNLKNTKIHLICVLLPSPENDLYWQPCLDGIAEAKEEFKSFNVSIKTYFFDPTSISSFTTANEAILKTSPDAVLLVPLFFKESLDIIENYNALGITSITFNNYLKSDSIKNFVGQDLFQSGRVAARLLDLLVKKGQIAIIHIDEDYENAVHMQEKEKGFKNYFKHLDNNDFEIITFKLEHLDFKNKLTNFLNEHSNLAGIFVTTSKAYQVAEITSEMNKNKISIIGYDLLASNVEFMNNNAIDFLIHQNPKRQAYLGTTSLIDYFIFDKEIPRLKILPIDIINSENATNYIL